MKSKFYLEDLKSGLVVFLVALPLCLGVAQASDAPLISGLFAGIVGGILVGLMSNSRVSVSGPAAGLTGVMAMAVITFKGDFSLIVLAGVVAGVIQLILGIIKAGSLSNYFPSAAIKGMLVGIGIILIIKEIPHFFGYDKDPAGDLNFIQADGENSFSEIINAINYICPPSFIIAILSMAILILWETKFIKKRSILKAIPSPLIVVIIGIIGTIFFSYLGGVWVIETEHMVSFPNLLEANNIHQVFTFPDFTGITNPDVYKLGLVIAAVASVETLLCIEAVDKLDHERNVTNTNRELIAQGTGNIVSGLIGGLPITSVIVRSSANLNAGAKTKMSTVFHGLLLASTILFIPDVLKLIPNSCLAAILIVTGYKLARISIFKNVYKQGWKYFLPFILTILVMQFSDLLRGVGCGIALSFVFILIENMQIPFKVSHEKVEGKHHFLVVVSQHITFLHKGSFVKMLNNIPPKSILTIDAHKTKFMDQDVTELLNEFRDQAHMKHIELEYINVKEVETIGH